MSTGYVRRGRRHPWINDTRTADQTQFRLLAAYVIGRLSLVEPVARSDRGGARILMLVYPRLIDA